jgi:hypothetical protein
MINHSGTYLIKRNARISRVQWALHVVGTRGRRQALRWERFGATWNQSALCSSHSFKTLFSNIIQFKLGLIWHLGATWTQSALRSSHSFKTLFSIIIQFKSGLIWHLQIQFSMHLSSPPQTDPLYVPSISSPKIITNHHNIIIVYMDWRAWPVPTPGSVELLSLSLPLSLPLSLQWAFFLLYSVSVSIRWLPRNSVNWG